MYVSFPNHSELFYIFFDNFWSGPVILTEKMVKTGYLMGRAYFEGDICFHPGQGYETRAMYANQGCIRIYSL